MRIFTYDTTLRDGAQSDTVFYSKNDKLNIIRLLDSLGIDFIEVDNPVYNPYDDGFFEELKNMKLNHSRIVAFGSTVKVGVQPQNDSVLSFLSSYSDCCAIFGKAWDLHVSDVLKTTNEENLRMISESIKYLKSKGKYVFFDAEHFFDGWLSSREYALAVLEAAQNAGADEIVLCDTNGGTFPKDIEKAVGDVKNHISVRLGIHTHNDCALAVANALSAVNEGAELIQGTINGIGERCGNADLAALIANLQIKSGFDVLPEGKIRSLTGISRAIAQITNISTQGMPYISRAAFSHKAGTHADAVLKNPATFEHIDPSLIGNKRTILLSEISGKSAIMPIIRRVVPDIDKNSDKVDMLLAAMKDREAHGYRYEAAQASFELLIRKMLGMYTPHFEVDMYKLISEAKLGEECKSYVFTEVRVDNQKEIAATTSDGPVHAIDEALRKALRPFFPSLDKVQLIDYKVRVMDNRSATGSTVQVLIDSTDGRDVWSTVGVSIDIIRASQEALIDSIEYKLLKDEKTSENR
ncbi:MAG: citramalate synthase [Clostridia bacterium]|nr:citramalate synthase [Clostridia bacterium]